MSVKYKCSKCGKITTGRPAGGCTAGTRDKNFGYSRNKHSWTKISDGAGRIKK